VESIVKRNKVGYRISGGYRGKGKRIPGRWVAKSSNFKKDNQSDEKFKANGGASFFRSALEEKTQGKKLLKIVSSCSNIDSEYEFCLNNRPDNFVSGKIATHINE
jgi:hypothetical protein